MIQETLVRPASHREAFELHEWLQAPLQRLKGRLQAARAYLSNLWSFLVSLRVLSYQLDLDGSVTVTHTPTGSWTRFRADGNVDTYAVRNNWQRGAEALLMNCSPEFDALSQEDRVNQNLLVSKIRASQYPEA